MVESILREFVEEEEETSNDGIGISFILMEILLLVELYTYGPMLTS